MLATLLPVGPATVASANTTVSRYDVFETTLTYSTGGMSNPWENATVTATFTAPSGANLNVDGFYYDVNTYKVRFTPAEIGSYIYSGSIVGPSGTQSFSGSFDSVPSLSHGFVRRVPGSPYQLQFEDGTFAALAGMNDCWQVNPPAPDQQTGVIGVASIEPPGEFGTVPIDTYFSKYGDGEGQYNLFRWNPRNCSYGIYQKISPSGNTYLTIEGQGGDSLLATAKQHGFHIQFCFFVGTPPYVNVSNGTPEADALKRYFRYAVARYGAYVDIWEMTNETDSSNVTDAWMTWTANYIRLIDPYVRLVTNSNPRSTDPNYLDVESPHFYGNWGDLYNPSNKSTGIPRVIGEAGALNDPIGASAQYQQDFQRVQLWTATFGRTGIAWWLSFYSHYPNTRNMYIGSQGRRTNSVLQSLVSGLEATAVSSQLSAPGATARGLTSSHEVLGYITRFAGPHASAPTTLTVGIPFANATAEWIDPGTGTVLQTFNPTSGNQVLTTPSFTEDVALQIVDQPSFSATLPVLK